MTDVKVEQCDQTAVDDAIETFTWQMSNFRPAVGESAALCYERRLREVFLPVLARHRQAAEKAQQERDAAYIEGKGGMIPGSTVFVSLITGENMPCMSGDARDKLSPHKRRQFDDATRDLATAIRSQNDDR